MTSGDTSENNKSNKEQSKRVEKNIEATSEWGYDLYPERKGDKRNVSISDVLIKGRGNEGIDKMKCEHKVYNCIKSSPLVKLMMGALNSSGCPIDIRRHIACEECSYKVTGGYDPLLNQIVVCQNTVSKESIMQGILTHEMIHMFDYCRNKLDFKNIEHLACTEIRAANLTHCSYLSGLLEGNIGLFNLKKAHQLCVKNKALQSIITVRTISREDAMKVIEKVFDKCYNDLEPIGRRIRRNSGDQYKVYAEGPYYGYDPEQI